MSACIHAYAYDYIHVLTGLHLYAWCVLACVHDHAYAFVGAYAIYGLVIIDMRMCTCIWVCICMCAHVSVHEHVHVCVHDHV